MLAVKNIHGETIPLYTIDYETYYASDFTLRKLTTTEYVRDPRFKVHGAAIVDPTGKSFWVTHNDIPDFFASVDWTKNGILSHNAVFDQFITSQIYGVVAAYNLCTMFMSYGEDGPGKSASLKAVCARLGLEGKLEGVLETTLGIRDLSSEQEELLIPYALQDAEQCRKAFEIFYYDRGYPEDELHAINLTIRMFVDPILQIDAAMCRAEIEQETIRVDNLLNSDIIKGAQLSDNCRSIVENKGVAGLMRSRDCFAELLKSRGVMPPMKNKVKNGVVSPDEFTFAFAKTDVELQALGEDPRVSDLVAVWLGSRSSLRKTRAERFLSASENGTKPFPMPLVYAGARTNRWSGRGTSLNIQNLPSGRDNLGSRLRQSIIAPKGWLIGSIDLSSIELRCSAWIAEEKELLEDLRLGVDAYSKMASLIYGVEVSKDGPYAHYRHVGKSAELGLSYGTGYKKLFHTVNTLYGNMVGDFSEDDAQRAVKIYREKRTGIVKVWDDFKQFLPMMAAGVANFPYKIWHIYPNKIQMASKLYIHYDKLHWEYNKETQQGNYVYNHGKEWTKLYAAKCYENVIQGMARDIMAFHMLEISKEFRILGTVHDEILVLLPENKAQEGVDWCLNEMRKAPSWCPDLPLDAEGKVGKCYSK